MNKELTPLEALEIVKWGGAGYTPFDFDNALSIVENSLKEKEKQDKVLKIIRDTIPDMCLIHNCDYVAEYNREIENTGSCPLTQEEFDLLKEVLV